MTPAAEDAAFEHGEADAPIMVDLFAGGGGASEGLHRALGVSPVLAINHNPKAVEMHAWNHPRTEHRCSNVWEVDPREAMAGRKVHLLWASPDCTHFSVAKGGKPRNRKIRGLAWIVCRWAAHVAPDVIILENMPEFRGWGPLTCRRRRKNPRLNTKGEVIETHRGGHPIKGRKGETFGLFVSHLEALGYVVEHRVLVAADYGAATSRKRLYMVARRDGLPIRWPEPTHGPGRAQPHRTAAEIVDWRLPVHSIFLSKQEGRAVGVNRPLADSTLARIAEGMRRYVLEAPRPFLVCLTHGGRLEGLDEPLRTTTTATRGERALVAPTLIQVGYGERDGQRPRSLDLHAPLGTVVGQGRKHALVAAFLARHNGMGEKMVVGRELDAPLPTITGGQRGTNLGLGVAFLEKFYGTATGAPLDAPLPTITGGGGRGGGHAALVAAFLMRYHGQGGQWQGLDQPLHTIDTTARHALITVVIDGVTYVITDIGMRMLSPRELARAHGFTEDYILSGNVAEQVERVGNSVVVDMAAALAGAQLRRAA